MTSEAWLNRVFRADFPSFLARAFRTVSPGARYLHNWHVDVLAEYLRRAVQGEGSRRLIVNMPPRCLKSVAVSVAFPAWLLGRNPSLRILTASYSEALAERMAQDCRVLMEEEWYKRAFPGTRLVRGENRRDCFVTTERGFRRSVSVGGTVTGEGGDVLVLDDPHNAMDVYSPKKRAYAVEWFEQAFMTRMNDPASACAVVVMQRLHPQDLTGYLTDKRRRVWTRLCLPAVATEDAAFFAGEPGREILRRQGDLLHAERLGPKTLETIRATVGEAGFQAQYLQQPQAAGETLLAPEHLRYYEERDVPDGGMIVQSWDTAVKTSAHCDYSAGVTLCVADGRYFVLDVVRRRAEYPLLKRMVREAAERFRPDAVLIEDKASGQALLQECRTDGLPLRAIMPKQDKVTRFLRTSAVFERGGVLLPVAAPWLDAYRHELTSFPQGEHDDQLDATVQAILWAEEKARAGRGRVRLL
jgi:predicted phage terminase large subunit-like protein